MPLDEGETLSRAVQQLRRACTDISNASADLGTVRDTMAREKLRKARQLAAQCMEKVGSILSSSAGAEFSALRVQFNTVKAEFDTINRESTRREKQTWRSSTESFGIGTAYDPRRELNGTGSRAGYSTVLLQDIKKIDLSEFETEEALQREKLLGVREIESNMMDLKTTYQEFRDLVHHQQADIDRVMGNVTETKTHVANGAEEIGHASRRQKCGRKFLCIIAIVLVVLIVVLGIVLLVLKR